MGRLTHPNLEILYEKGEWTAPAGRATAVPFIQHICLCFSAGIRATSAPPWLLVGWMWLELTCTAFSPMAPTTSCHTWPWVRQSTPGRRIKGHSFKPSFKSLSACFFVLFLFHLMSNSNTQSRNLELLLVSYITIVCLKCHFWLKILILWF